MKSLFDSSRFKENRTEEEEGEISDEKYLVDTTGLAKYKKPKKLSLQQLIKQANGTDVVTKDIVQALFLRYGNHRFLINNAYIFTGWESDFITVTESMYVYEIECKMTKSDYQEDFLKKEKHSLLESASTSGLLTPNRFYYAAPRGMLASYEIPSYAGLLEVSRDKEGGLVCVTTKEAPFLHKEDVFSNIKDALLQKLSWRYRDIMLNDYENAINILTDEEKGVDL
jgi:hypothetical protein